MLKCLHALESGLLEFLLAELYQISNFICGTFLSLSWWNIVQCWSLLQCSTPSISFVQILPNMFCCALPLLRVPFFDKIKTTATLMDISKYLISHFSMGYAMERSILHFELASVKRNEKQTHPVSLRLREHFSLSTRACILLYMTQTGSKQNLTIIKRRYHHHSHHHHLCRQNAVSTTVGTK